MIVVLTSLRKVRPAARRTLLEELPSWLVEGSDSPIHASLALECLALCRALPSLAADLSTDLWWSLLEHLVRLTERGERQSPLDRDPWIHQLFAAELRLTLAAQFPEIETCRQLADAGYKALSRLMEQTRVGDGLLPCRHLPWLRPLLACWTRCRDLSPASDPQQQNGHTCWPADADPVLRQVLRQALRLTRRDGSPAFSKQGDKYADVMLFTTAAQRFGTDEDRRLVQQVLQPSPRGKTKANPFSQSVLPACHAEEAETSVLRSSWMPDGEQLTLTFGGRRLMAELESSRGLICSGEWNTELRVDGEILSPKSDWQEVCWVSDEDCDYLELELGFESNARLQRQMLLARKDRFLFVADAILAGELVRKIEHRLSLPLAADVAFQAAAETREGILSASPAGKSAVATRGRLQALVLPLALPEWRIDRRVGSLECNEGKLSLRQATSAGRAMFAPLFIDLDPRRMTRPATWRQLTVAENREIQPIDETVGYRVEIGKEQWLIYRSLGPRGNRTVLGHNLVTEMLVARFGRDGEVDTILEIE